MFPYVFPWPIPGDVLGVLAHAAAVGIAVVLAAWARRWAPAGGAARWIFLLVVAAGVFAAGEKIIAGLSPIETQPFPLRWYGVLIGLGFVLAIHLAARDGERSGIATKRQVHEMSFRAFLASLVGSRVLFIVVNWG